MKAPNIIAKDSYVFMIGELEKVDEVIKEPLAGTTWPRDMPVVTGGGMVESIASIDVSYNSSGKNSDNLILIPPMIFLSFRPI